MNGKDKIKQLKADGVKRVKIAFTDMDGIQRAKYISIEKFAGIVDGTSGFCDCVLGWDSNDQLYDNTTFTGWHTAYPDALYRVDLSTERLLAEENNIPLYLVDLVNGDGTTAHDLCPRNVLRRVLTRAADMGFGANAAFEYEFFIFNETSQSIRDKGYRNLTPLSPGNFGYSLIRASTYSDMFNDLMDYCQDLNIEIEGLHCETGPGVWETAIGVDSAMNAADKAVLFKTLSKVFFLKRDLMATFMAKWSMDHPGQSGHMHHSLFDLKSGDNLFHNKDNAYNMSELMVNYVAGMQKYLKPMLCMCAPTINSYTRLVKGAWAPTSATWGVENRTTALRVIPGSAKSQRVEYRVGPADANPYLVAAATIGAGLLGIEEGLTLGEPIKGNAYAVEDALGDELQLPSNLKDSTRNFEQSAAARKLFGDDFVNHYAATRYWEVREHEKAVTSWQLERYFEII